MLSLEDALLYARDRLDLERAQVNLRINELAREDRPGCGEQRMEMNQRSNELLRAWEKLDGEIDRLRSLGVLPRPGKFAYNAVYNEAVRVWDQCFAVNRDDGPR